MSVGNALNEAVHAEASKVVCPSAGGVLARLVPEQWSKMLADILVSEGALDQDEEKQEMEQGLNARVSEAQAGGAVAVDEDRPLHLLEGCFANEAIVAEALV